MKRLKYYLLQLGDPQSLSLKLHSLQVLPIIGLYNPADRLPLRCGYAPLDLNPVIMAKPTDAIGAPHVGDTGSPAAPQATTGLCNDQPYS